MLSFLLSTAEGAIAFGTLVIILLIALIVPLVFGGVTAHIGAKKGYSKFGFFLLGFFTAFIGVIVALIVEDKTRGRRIKRVIYEDEDEEEEDEEYE